MKLSERLKNVDGAAPAVGGAQSGAPKPPTR